MSAQQLAKAELVIGSETITVQFNPVSLQVEITNSASPQGGSGATTQVATQSSAKMNLELLFDTSSSGEDVRNKTRPLRATVRAPDPSSGGGGGASSEAGAAFVPPHIVFQWGTFMFAGIADSYRETLDFFSADGVPLRAQVVLALKEQPNEFTALERPNPRGAASANAFQVPSELQGLSGAAGVASLGGDLRAARAIAGANGELSLRFGGGKTLSVEAGIQLREPVGFVAEGGVSVSAPALRFDASRLTTSLPSGRLATDAGAGFSIDGRALPQSPSGLRSDVGQNTPLSARLRFDA
ncbi:MAG: hypothetical protein IV097_18185 [Burkholderiaceae bacterium]|nr:hypothetical protein [Burkholderiaceae bacterium]